MGTSPEHCLVQEFWDLATGLSFFDKMLLLHFMTGSEAPPDSDRGGTNIGSLTKKGKSIHPQAFLGAVLCIKPREYAHLIQRSCFDPCTGGLKI